MRIQASRGYAMCFGCGRDNHAGLHLDFHQETEEVIAEGISFDGVAGLASP